MTSSSTSSNANAFVPDEDLTETLPDGRTIQAAVKGVAIPVAEAERLGLVKGSKAENPVTENKLSKPPAENKSGK